MPADTALEDDYIISLLKRDADDHKKRYATTTSTNGPLLSNAKRRADAPKPNTRFLKNIIRETDCHNAALKAKEEGERKARLRSLREEGEAGGKRKRDDRERVGGEEIEGKRRRPEGRERKGRWASALGWDGAGDIRPRKERKEGEGKQRRSKENGDDVRGERGTHRHRHRRDRSLEEHPERSHRKSHTSERRRSRERSRSPHHRKEHRRRPRSTSPLVIVNEAKNSDPGLDSDDPLTALLGPQPPNRSQPLPRGRNALKPSGMDSRFKQNYNPTTDVARDHDEEDDWDMALEALKARTKWRTQGAERLRAAGFTDEEIERWEKGGGGGGPPGGGGGEKDAVDVRWRKKGEGREWDRGKVLDEDGEGGVEVKAEWAR